jgi:ABC-2 type transport system permease protein
VLVLALTGLGAGVTYGIIVSDFSRVPELLAAALAYLPATWVLVGVALALYGLVPRATAVAWLAYALVLLSGLLGDLLKLPDWVNELSPFEHVPSLPLDDFALLPMVLLTAVAAALIALGLTGFRRRDTPA